MSELGWGEGYECGQCHIDMEIMPYKSLHDPVSIRCPRCKQVAQVG